MWLPPYAGAFAGEHAGEAILETPILAEHEADLAAADADVARGHVGALADVARQLVHQRLAEAHHLALALSLRIEVRAALAAAHRQTGERILERLLEAEEFENAQGHAWGETACRPCTARSRR